MCFLKALRTSTESVIAKQSLESQLPCVSLNQLLWQWFLFGSWWLALAVHFCSLYDMLGVASSPDNLCTKVACQRQVSCKFLIVLCVMQDSVQCFASSVCSLATWVDSVPEISLHWWKCGTRELSGEDTQGTLSPTRVKAWVNNFDHKKVDSELMKTTSYPFFPSPSVILWVAFPMPSPKQRYWANRALIILLAWYNLHIIILCSNKNLNN